MQEREWRNKEHGLISTSGVSPLLGASAARRFHILFGRMRRAAIRSGCQVQCLANVYCCMRSVCLHRDEVKDTQHALPFSSMHGQAASAVTWVQFSPRPDCPVQGRLCKYVLPEVVSRGLV